MSKNDRKKQQKNKVRFLTGFLVSLLLLSSCGGNEPDPHVTDPGTAISADQTESLTEDSKESSTNLISLPDSTASRTEEEESSVTTDTEKDQTTSEIVKDTESSESSESYDSAESTEKSDPESDTRTETASDTKDDTSSDTESDHESDTETDTGFDTSPSSESDSSETVVSGSESQDPPPERDFVRFLGHFMDAWIAEINQRTLANPQSMLFDVTKTDVTFTAGEIFEKISSYAFPDTALYGDVPPDDNIKSTLLAARNTAELEVEPGRIITPEYAILTENTAVRNFPTELKARNSTDDRAFDYFRETVLALGNGVLVLHYSQDRNYAFVQGYNYAGWVTTSSLAFTDRETYAFFLNPESFLICTHPDLNDPGSRLGLMLPYKDKQGSVYSAIYPERDENGQLRLEERALDIETSAASWSDGFLPFSVEEVIRRACLLTDFTYGWSDEDNRYDCSSTTGLLYLLFGIYMPRNTAIMPAFGGSVTALADVSDRDQVIDAHPGALLIMPGHVMLYLYRSEDGKHVVLHNTTYNGEYRVIINRLEDMVTASGVSYPDLLTYIIYIQ